MNATDLTTLAVRMQNARAGLPGPADRPAPPAAARGKPMEAARPAVAVTLSAEALERAAAEAPKPEAPEAPSGISDARRAVRAQAAQAADAMWKQLSWMEALVRKFDETGEVWTGDNNGRLVPRTDGYDYAVYGGPAAYVERLRGGLEGYRRSMEHELRVAAEW